MSGFSMSCLAFTIVLILISTPLTASEEVIQTVGQRTFGNSLYENRVSAGGLVSDSRLYLSGPHWDYYGGFVSAQRSESGTWTIGPTEYIYGNFEGGMALNRVHDTVFFGEDGALLFTVSSGPLQELSFPLDNSADESSSGFRHIASVGDWFISTTYSKYSQATSDHKLWFGHYDASGSWTHHSIVTIPNGAVPLSVTMGIHEDGSPIFAVVMDPLDVVVYRVVGGSVVSVQTLPQTQSYWPGLKAAAHLSPDGSFLALVYTDQSFELVDNFVIYNLEGDFYQPSGFTATLWPGYLPGGVLPTGPGLSLNDDSCLIVITGMDGTPIYLRTGPNTWERFKDIDLSSVQYPRDASFFGSRLAVVDSPEDGMSGSGPPFTLARAFEVPKLKRCYPTPSTSDGSDSPSQVLVYVSITLGVAATLGFAVFAVVRLRGGAETSSSEGLLTRSATLPASSDLSDKLNDAVSPSSADHELAQPVVVEAPPSYTQAIPSVATLASSSAPPDRPPRKRSSSGSTSRRRRRRSSSRSSSSRRRGPASGGVQEGSSTPSAPQLSLSDLHAERETLLAEIDAAREALATHGNSNNKSLPQNPETAIHAPTAPPVAASPDPVTMSPKEEPFSTAFELTVIGFGLEASLAAYMDRLASNGFVLDDHGVIHRYLLKWKEPESQDQEEKDESPSFWWLFTVVVVTRLFGLVGLGVLLLIIFCIEGTKSSPTERVRELVPVPRCPQELRQYIQVSADIWHRTTVNLDEISAYHLPPLSGPVESPPPYNLD